MGGGPVCFASRRQTAIALSSTEAEYIAGSEAARELAWLTQLLSEPRMSHPTPTLNIDNQSTIKLIENGDTKKRTKDIALRYDFIRDQHKRKQFKLKHVNSESQPADLLTKPLSGPRIRQLLEGSKVLCQPMMKQQPTLSGAVEPASRRTAQTPRPHPHPPIGARVWGLPPQTRDQIPSSSSHLGGEGNRYKSDCPNPERKQNKI